MYLRLAAVLILSEHGLQCIGSLLAVVGAETLNGVQVRKVTGQYDVVKKANAIWDGPDNVDPGSRDS